MYKAIDIANYIVNLAIDVGCPVSNLTLQKILYYVQAASLVENDECIFEDPIVAWKYGPVVESVYHKFKVYANDKINEKVETLESLKIKDNVISFELEPYNPNHIIDLKTQIMIERVFKSKMYLNAFDLVKKTHEETPWKSVEISENISKEKMKQYFKVNKERIYGA